MMNIRYTPDTATIEIAEIMDDLRKDIEWHNNKADCALAEDGKADKGKETARRHQLRAARLQKHLITLQAVLRRLELTNDITMNFIAEDISERILQVRKDPLADKFVGVLVYYEFKPRWQWRDDGRNMVACVSSIENWPDGNYGMRDMGDGKFIVESDRPMPGAWVLGGQWVPIPVSKQIEETKGRGLADEQR